MEKRNFMTLPMQLMDVLKETEMLFVRGGVYNAESANNGNGICDGANNASGKCNGTNNADGKCSGVNNENGVCKISAGGSGGGTIIKDPNDTNVGR